MSRETVVADACGGNHTALSATSAKPCFRTMICYR